MRKNLLSEIKRLKDISNVVILTHNIDFVFVQSLLLRSFKNAGAPKLTIFADAQCASEAFTRQSQYLSSLGRRYRVVPVPSKLGFRFHPKACLLSGDKSAHLYVGSGNLTFGGWGENAEVWAHYRSGEELAAFRNFHDYLNGIVDQLSLSQTIAQEVEDAFDVRKHSWNPEGAGNIDQDQLLFWRNGSGPALVDSIIQQLGGSGGDSCTICSPYYDEKAEAFDKLFKEIRAARTQVLVTEKGNNLTSSAYQHMSSVAELHAVNGVAPDHEGAKPGIVHAKFYSVQLDDEVRLLLGSANCSHAALTCDGDSGNSELLAFKKMSTEEYESEFLSELEMSDAEPMLEGDSGEAKEDETKHSVRILAARKEPDKLCIAYAPKDIEVVGICFEHGLEVADIEDPGVCFVKAPHETMYVRLRAKFQDEEIETEPHWVDHEQDLATTSYRRMLADVLRTHVHESSSSAEVLGDAVKFIVQDLQETSKRSAFQQRNRFVNEGGDVTYTRDDLYSTRISHAFSHRSIVSQSLPRVSIAELILHYLGYYDIDAHSETSAARDIQVESGIQSEAEYDEDVDHPEEIAPAKPVKPPKPDSPAELEKRRKKFMRFLTKMVETFESDYYSQHRHPIDVARDIKLVALVARALTQENYISWPDLYDATHRIISSLFLEDDETLPYAILDAASTTTSSPLLDPEVAASLFAWSLLIKEDPKSPEEADCLLAVAVAVSKFPMIWQSHQADALVEAVNRILHTGNHEYTYKEIHARWDSLMKLSATLRQFEKILGEGDLKDWLVMNQLERIQPGDLVFQGSRGFGVCACDSEVLLNGKKHVEIQFVRTGGEDCIEIPANYLNPVRGLLDSDEFLARLRSSGVEPLVLSQLCERTLQRRL
ncbi:MAG: hypothetical protein CL946_03570 [Ectothiorhodospiraceae bacterium]|nr:hypothetical protein [Ectothiorhodospiraceae bacterium]